MWNVKEEYKRKCKICDEYVDTAKPNQLYCEEHMTLNYYLNRMYHRLQDRATRTNLSFNITKDYLFDLIPEDMVCPVLEIKMTFGDASGRNSSPSVDRIDSNKGYVVGNLQIMSKLANTMKSNATPEQLLKFADWIIDEYS